MRVLITGGGTGGHLYPALAVAGILKEEDPSGEILFVGTREGLESSVVPARGFAFRAVAAAKWPRRLSLHAPAFPLALSRGYRQSLAIIREWRPQSVFATGGYVSVPLVLAAARLRVPIFLHEQNAVPGLANRLLSRWAHTVYLTFPARSDSISGNARVVHSGLPVRQEILKTSRAAGLDYFQLSAAAMTILVTGGSRGARRLNEVMLQVYRQLGAAVNRSAGSWPRLQFIHVTGKAEYPEFIQQMAAQGINEDNVGRIVIRPYLEEMEYGLAAADLLISRAGAATIAELTALAIPAILVPYPYAAGDHQYQNALFLDRQRAAMMIPEPDLTAELLLWRLKQLIGNDERRQEMGRAAGRLGRPQAAEIIARSLLQAAPGFDPLERARGGRGAAGPGGRRS